jgi:heme/copper-type cytochrome/quinol oxidase subunit 2
MNLRLLSIIAGVLTVLLAIDGIYMLVSKYNGNETQNFGLHDGATVLIAAGILLVITIIAFVMSTRSANHEGIVPVPEAPVTDNTTAEVRSTEVEPEVKG